MDKKELLKLLRTNVKVFAYVTLNQDSGDYIQLVKSDFIKAVKESSADSYFDNVDVTENCIIYIN